MDATLIIIIVGVFLLSSIGGFIWWYLARNTYKYIFELISRDGKNTTSLKAKLVRDPDNNKIKKFAFKSNNTLLSVREPHGHKDGKAVRRITYNMEGEYVYIKGYEVNEKEYLSLSLDPQAKELALYQYQTNQRRNPILDKMSIFTFLSSVIMLFLMLGATVYMGITYSKTSKDMVLIGQENSKSASSIASYNELILESNKVFLAASNNLGNYCSGLSGGSFVGSNLTRSLNPQSTS